MYELFYWPTLQGRGEFVRLVLEDVGVAYRDVGRNDPAGGKRIVEALRGELAPFVLAVPALRDGDRVLWQTAAITRYLGERHGLAPADEPARLATHALALTIADLVSEAHDTHHPLTVAETYEQQRDAALLRAKAFRELRLPKFLPYLERLLEVAPSPDRSLVGDATSYADLAVFQVVTGLRYAFPNAMARVGATTPRLNELCERIAARPRLAAYLASPRRLAFNQHGIFRHYPELDP